MSSEFEEILRERVLIFDGAMGTYLYSLGVPRGHCYDELSLSRPELIKRIHREYASAGADILTTNTFGANRHILDKYYDLGVKTVDINVAAARIARRVASEFGDRRIFVAGDVGPVTRKFECEEEIACENIGTIFAEQIQALAEGGVDLIFFETFGDLTELLIAIDTARRVAPELPIIASMSFVDGKTLVGNDPEQVGIALAEKEVLVAGANCGRGPRGILEAAKQLGKVFPRFVLAKPNAGLPRFVDGQFHYPATPEYFADFARRAHESGINIVGGCCGTTPEHIRAVAEAVGGKRPRKRKVVPAVKVAEKPEVGRRYPRARTSLEKKIAAGFVLTMEIDPPRGIEVSKLVRAARMFKELGGDAVNVSDLPMARMRMSALGLASVIRLRAGIDIVLHFTARDRNLIAMQSDLLSAYALGIDNILALRGDPPAVGDYPFATGVFDISTFGLVRLISSFNEGRDLLGNPLDMPTSFFIGVGFNQNSNFERELERLEKKIQMGAHFVQTQPMFDPVKIERLAEYLKGKNIPIIVSIMPLISARNAEFLHNEVPGISIPKEIRERFERISSREKAMEEGIAIARDMLSAARDIAQGACIMPQLGKYDMVERIIF